MKNVTKEKTKRDQLAYPDPVKAEQHKDAGNLLFKAGDFPGAIKEFNEGLKRDPVNKFLYSNRSFAYIKLMEPTSAMKDADKALELDPLFVKAWARKGTCHQLHKEFHKAMENRVVTATMTTTRITNKIHKIITEISRRMGKKKLKRIRTDMVLYLKMINQRK